MPRTCSATRKDGSPCQIPMVGDASHCWAHDPAKAAARAEARARGGRNRSTVARLEKRRGARLTAVVGRLEAALEKVEDGRLSPQQGTAVASIARALATIYEVAELEARLAALEAQQQPADRSGRAWG